MTQPKNLLEAARRSTTGWTLRNLHRLLTYYGFERTRRRRQDTYKHEVYPDILMSVTRNAPIPRAYVDTAVKKIEESLQRGTTP